MKRLMKLIQKDILLIKKLEKKGLLMAETSEGKKKVYVHSHTKEDGTEVRTHYRSTPNTSTGKKNK